MNGKNLDDFEIRLDGEAPVFLFEGKPYSGRINEVRSSRIASTFVVKDGYKDGQEVVYSDAGSIEGNINYFRGLLHGRIEHFYPNGNLEDQAQFELGVCLASSSYDEAGAVVDRFEIDEAGPEYQRLLSQRRSLPLAHGHDAIDELGGNT